MPHAFTRSSPQMLLWAWPATAMALSVVAVIIAHRQAATLHTLIHTYMAAGVTPSVPVVRDLHDVLDWLFLLPFGAALLFGVAVCIAYRWPRQPAKLACGVLFCALAVLMNVTRY